MHMQTCTVRNSTGSVIFAAWPIVIGCIGFAMAVQGRGHWKLWMAATWAALGVINVFYIAAYRTVFTVSGMQQSGLLRRMRSYSYSDVQSVGIGKGMSANAITMTFADGHKMTVYGSEKQLINAQSVLSNKLPHLRR
jgi:hypothetical protein